MKKDIIYLGTTQGRKTELFGIYAQDRFEHMYVLGATGTGKSTLLCSLVLQDVIHEHGLIVLDPHGDLATRLANSLRSHDPILIDLFDQSCPYAYNPLAGVSEPYIPLVVSGFMESLKRLFEDAWGSRMEAILRYTLYALIEHGEAVMGDILRFLEDDVFRSSVVKNLKNEEVRRYWDMTYGKYPVKIQREMILPIQTKIGALLCDPKLNAFFTRKGQLLRFRALMDVGKVVIINLAKGKIGQDSAALMGSLMLTSISYAGLSRANQEESMRVPVFVYLDEAHLLTTTNLVEMVSELRKYKVGLIFAHQESSQLPEAIRSVILGNVGTLIIFRVGYSDARYFSQVFGGCITAQDIMNLGAGLGYIRLLIKGEPSRTFQMRALTSHEVKDFSG